MNTFLAKPDITLERVKNRLLDSVVVGGGISGLACARTLADANLDVLLLEKNIPGNLTSANSLRIIHGGLRYLSRLNLKMTIESLKDQTLLLKEAPGLVKVLPCVLPFDKGRYLNRFIFTSVAKLYNLVSEIVVGRSNQARILKPEFLNKYLGNFCNQTVDGALLWYDARIRDPHKLHALILHKLDRSGGEVLSNANVTKIVKEKFGLSKKVYQVFFDIEGKQLSVTAKTVVNTAGPHLQTIKLENLTGNNLKLCWAKAFNIILDQKLQDRFAIAIKSKLNRLYFLVPRGGNSVLGTGYLPCSDPVSDLVISDNHVKAIIEDCFGGNNYTYSLDVGVIPVESITPGGEKVSFLGRPLIFNNQGYIEVINTKYSGFYSLSNRVLSICKKF